jgi:hypothetical protein
MQWISFLMLALTIAGCGGGSPAPAANSVPPSHAHRKVVLASRVQTTPDRCASSRGECLPNQNFVRKLCDGVHPDVALYFFRAGSPWQRFYMLAQAKPYNASGGVSLLGELMEYGEEVIALRRHAGTGEIQIGDQTGYDVLRWNGSCATIHDGDFSNTPPRHKGHSRVEWPKLSDETQQALTLDPTVLATYRDRRNQCKGVTNFGLVSLECISSDHRLVEEIVRYVRSSPSIPEPDALR